MKKKTAMEISQRLGWAAVSDLLHHDWLIHINGLLFAPDTEEVKG